MQRYKNREIDGTREVEVYRNLHRDCWSIRQDGVVVAHANSVGLTNCTFKVSQAGRQRVLRDQKKNVHAKIVGTLNANVIRQPCLLIYNPYGLSYFHGIFEGHKELTNAERVHLGSHASYFGGTYIEHLRQTTFT